MPAWFEITINLKSYNESFCRASIVSCIKEKLSHEVIYFPLGALTLITHLYLIKEFFFFENILVFSSLFLNHQYYDMDHQL